jgi:hypothetical protein
MPMNVRASGNVHARSTGRTRSSVRTSGVCPYRDPPDGRTYGPANPPMARIARPYVHARQLPPSRCASARARSRSRSRDPRGPVARDHPVTPSSSSTRCSGTATESGSCDHPVTSASGTVVPYGIAARNMTAGYVPIPYLGRDRAGSPQVLPGRRAGLLTCRPARPARVRRVVTPSEADSRRRCGWARGRYRPGHCRSRPVPAKRPPINRTTKGANHERVQVRPR